MATSITSLPEEIIANILRYNVITVEDIINFRCVCKHFQYAATYGNVMEKKCIKRWPTAKKEYDFKKQEEERTNFQKKGIYYMNQFKNDLSRVLFEEYYDIKLNKKSHNISNNKLLRFNDKLNECLNWHSRQTSVTSKKRMEFLFYVDEIRYLLTQFPRGLNGNLLVEYCDINKSHYKKARLIKTELTKLMLKPEKEQFLEKTVIHLTQYIQLRKYVYYSSISASLDKIADEVLNCLREKHPYHSIFSTSDEFFSYWKYHNIDNNHWDEVESTQIMDILQEYIFGKLNFRPRLCGYKDFDYLCIDYVLENKYGNEIIVYIIYQCVARRLGLRCDVQYFDMSSIDMPNRFCIFWKSKYITDDIVNERCFYILRKEYPNCLVDITSHYKCLVSRPPPDYTLKGTERIFYLIKKLNRQLIQALVIYYGIGLVRVKWDMLPNYTVLLNKDIHRRDNESTFYYNYESKQTTI